VWSPEYDNPQDKKWRYEGDDYSFLYYAGFEKMGITSLAKGINFMEDGYEFKIPVYLIQGEHDILTSKTTTQPYFDKISAPKKEYFLLPNSAHDFSEEVIEAEWKVLTEYVLNDIK
jgi:pimeloyl-ACP methyl ester carboxylesterase